MGGMTAVSFDPIWQHGIHIFFSLKQRTPFFNEGMLIVLFIWRHEHIEIIYVYIYIYKFINLNILDIYMYMYIFYIFTTFYNHMIYYLYMPGTSLTSRHSWQFWWVAFFVSAGGNLRQVSRKCTSRRLKKKRWSWWSKTKETGLRRLYI